ncbi:MAG: hypothetical protein A3E19_00720, partial [Planctomycetes bacterium RIFCSPHIGHO2_12_FULL_52_36]
MAIIHIIREKIARREYEFTTPHFFEEMADDNLTLVDVEVAIANGRVRRRFTRDPRGRRYEVVGPTTDGREIAIICRIKNTGKLLLITTYLLE